MIYYFSLLLSALSWIFILLGLTTSSIAALWNAKAVRSKNQKRVARCGMCTAIAGGLLLLVQNVSSSLDGRASSQTASEIKLASEQGVELSKRNYNAIMGEYGPDLALDFSTIGCVSLMIASSGPYSAYSVEIVLTPPNKQLSEMDVPTRLLNIAMLTPTQKSEFSFPECHPGTFNRLETVALDSSDDEFGIDVTIISRKGVKTELIRAKKINARWVTASKLVDATGNISVAVSGYCPQNERNQIAWYR